MSLKLHRGNAQDDRQNLADPQNPHRRKTAYALTVDGDSPLQYLPPTIEAEITQRLDDLESGKAQTVDADEALRRIDVRLRRR
jgi:hypothetical protein